MNCKEPEKDKKKKKKKKEKIESTDGSYHADEGYDDDNGNWMDEDWEP